MTSIKEIWRDFYTAERDFHNLVMQTLTLKHSINDSSKQVGLNTDSIVLPAYIREIWLAKDNAELERFQAHWQNVDDLYMYAMDFEGRTAKTKPKKFPLFLKNVSKILLSKHTAFSSILLDGTGNLKICRYPNNDDGLVMLHAAKDDLAKIGIHCSIVKVDSSGWIYLTAQQIQIMDYFSDIPNIRYRRNSGYQYRARVHFKGQDKKEGTRYNAGFLICSGDFDIRSHKKAEPRAHRTESVKAALQFNCNTNGMFVDFYNDDE
ncbi:hypothetical protein HC723_16010 [Vibrio sp. S11_S32]|uniref:hypothetical protein n=1 Tax=Vibrio sp. S11_S32 TaxID=2720225 RepID=UPI0016814583|nr:hypothetical protein [Vibrio sp. S11_S32]MBD1577900.1 hypothetical protein [Vibrio sp. S11_S32]